MVKKRLLRIKETAEMLGVNPETLRRWDKPGGKLRAVIISTRGDRRYKKEDLDVFIKNSMQITTK